MGIEALLRLHSGLPRQGPGSDASTREALRRLPKLGESPSIVYLGCGPGRQTLVLAREFGVPVLAVDVLAPFLEELERAAEAAGLSEMVRAHCGSMDHLAVAHESLDLVWSEGALYNVGVDQQLRYLLPLMKSGGVVAFSELSWLSADPIEELRVYWELYPGMRTTAANVAAYEGIGYRVVDQFVLPESDWWTEYYNPLLARIERLRAEAERDAALAEVLTETEREIDVYRRFSRDYGYVFYLCRKD